MKPRVCNSKSTDVVIVTVFKETCTATADAFFFFFFFGPVEKFLVLLWQFQVGLAGTVVSNSH